MMDTAALIAADALHLVASDAAAGCLVGAFPALRPRVRFPPSVSMLGPLGPMEEVERWLLAQRRRDVAQFPVDHGIDVEVCAREEVQLLERLALDVADAKRVCAWLGDSPADVFALALVAAAVEAVGRVADNVVRADLGPLRHRRLGACSPDELRAVVSQEAVSWAPVDLSDHLALWHVVRGGDVDQMEAFAATAKRSPGILDAVRARLATRVDPITGLSGYDVAILDAIARGGVEPEVFLRVFREQAPELDGSNWMVLFDHVDGLAARDEPLVEVERGDGGGLVGVSITAAGRAVLALGGPGAGP